MLLFLCFYCTAEEIIPEEIIPLEMVIARISRYFIGRIPADSTVVVLNIDDETHRLSEYLIEELTENIINNSSLKVVERKKLESLLEEMNFGMSGYVDDESAQKIGHILGARIIVSGSIRYLTDKILRLQLKAITVETAQITGMQSENLDISGDATLRKLFNYREVSTALITRPEINFGFHTGGGPNGNNYFITGIDTQLGIMLEPYRAAAWIITLDAGFGLGIPYLYDYYAGLLVEFCLLDGAANIGAGGGISTGSIPYIRFSFSNIRLEFIKIGIYFDRSFGKGTIESGFKIGLLCCFRIPYF